MTLQAATLKRLAKRAGKLALVAVGELPSGPNVPISEKKYAQSYEPAESFTDYLPWLDYDPDTQVLEFDDHINVGALFELVPVDVDGKPDTVLHELEKNLVRALHTLPQDQDSPYIVQLYLQDEPIDPAEQTKQFREYAREEARESEHASAWFEALHEHYRQLQRGLFRDPLNGQNWRAKKRRVRCCLYRYKKRSAYLDKLNRPIPGALSPAEDLNNAVIPFIRMMEQNGVTTRRCSGEDMYHWMLPWFSPRPTGYSSATDYLKDRPYPDDSDKAVAFDLGAAVTTDPPMAMPQNGDYNGVYLFNDQPQRFISLAALDSPPAPGMITADRRYAGTLRPALWEQMPAGSVFTLTIIVKPKQQIDSHIARILGRAKGGSFEEDIAIEQAEAAQESIARGHRIYSLYSGVYIKSIDLKAMTRDTLDALTVLRSAGLNPTDPATDPIATDCFIRNLPFCYDVRHDTQHAKRSRLTYDTHITRLFPLFGRGIGTGNPGTALFNRIGENLFFDPFNPQDKKKSSHGVIFGPTGSGKSAFLTYWSLHSMAMRKPRQYFIEKGASFDLLAQWFRSKGLSVQQYTFTPKADISLPPYAMMDDALRQIDAQLDDNIELEAATLVIDQSGLHASDDAERYEDDQRDYLGEMELLTQMMITGADEKTNERMTQQDRRAIQQSIIKALRKAREEGRAHPIVSDICDELKTNYQNETMQTRQTRVREMQESLELWTESTRGKFFNRIGQAWPECDATFFDMGMLTQDQNADMLSVALISLVNTITGIGEKYQFHPRETEVVIDEGHVISKNPILVKPFVFGVKTWRKLKISLQMASQNLDDYPDKAKSMLNLAEWWYCLVMPKEEINEISRFRSLNDEQKLLLETATKANKKYTEGVVMSDDLNSLFRVVMPGLALGLAGTDGDEKILRRQIIKDMGFSGPDAMLNAGIEAGKRITLAREGKLQ